MSWEHRPYASDSEPRYSGEARSWLGGLPPMTKAVKWIVIANVSLFLLCLLTGGSQSFLYKYFEMSTFDVIHRGQLWRLITFSYLHSANDFGHIFFNMLGLYFLGVILERHWGPGRFFAFYTLGSVAAVSLYVLLSAVGWLDPRSTLVGASGGVFAVAGAVAVLFPSVQLILFVFPVPIRAAVLVAALFFVFNLVTQGFNAGGNACHLAGLAFGVAWGYRGHGWESFWRDWNHERRVRAVESKAMKVQNLQIEVDRILEKVHQQGIGSLTRGEKQLLEEATRRQQEEDRLRSRL